MAIKNRIYSLMVRSSFPDCRGRLPVEKRVSARSTTTCTMYIFLILVIHCRLIFFPSIHYLLYSIRYKKEIQKKPRKYWNCPSSSLGMERHVCLRDGEGVGKGKVLSLSALTHHVI